MAERRVVRHIALLVGLAVVYVAAGKAGLTLATVHPSATAVWPPTGIALAALLLGGNRLWPAILIGAFVVNITNAGSIATSLGIGVGNTLEAVVGAYLVRRFANGAGAFDHARDVFRFVLAGALVSTLVSATIGVTTITLGGMAGWEDFGPIWLTWWLGDAVGALVVTSVILAWAQPSAAPRAVHSRLEGIALFLSIGATGAVVFGGLVPTITQGSMGFLCIPPLIWSAFRFSSRTTTLAVLMVSTIAVAGTRLSLGPFIAETTNVSLLMLQAFMGVVAVMTLALAAVVSERRTAQHSLENRVADRTRALAEAVSKLEDAQDALMRRERLAMLGELAGGVSHELRNPLAVMTNALHYLAAVLRDAPANVREYLEILRGQVALSDRIVANLLDLARAKAPQRGPVALGKAVDAALKRATGLEKVRVSTDIPDELPRAYVDEVHLGQILLNLMTNAAQAMGDAGGDLSIRAARVGAESLRLEVVDTGPGITAEHLPRVFEPLFSTKARGMGLGLAVSRTLARANDGELSVISRGDGATFTLVIPSVGPEHA